MSEITDILREIGFSEKEAALYLTLLRFGPRPITFLASKAGVNRGLAYALLHDLLEKGFVTKQSKGRVLSFSPLEPERLVQHLETKKKNISKQQERVKGVLGQLAAIANPLSSKPKIRSFDGVEGARTLLADLRTAKATTIQAYVSFAKTVDFVGDEYFSSFLETLINYGYKIDIIRTREKGKEVSAYPLCTALIQKNYEQLRIRYAPYDLPFPLTLFLYDEKMALLSSQDESFAVLIESKEFKGLQKNLFDLLWNSLEQTTVNLGILHSLSGTMAISERPVVDAIMLAIDEINETGGILGRRIDPILVDGQSNPEVFAKQAEILIAKHNVVSIFGGWTSASRKMIKPVVEQFDNLLWYSVQFEGLESSPNIIYAGASPNQQILPAVDWAVKTLGDKCFLVGSDYVFPRTAHEIIKGRLEELGASVVGETFNVLGDTDFRQVAQKIRKARPDFIFNTINGDSNLAFFNALRAAKITAKQIPTVSFSIGEEEVSRMQSRMGTGDYAAWSYFESLESKDNREFVRSFQKKYGKHRRIGDPVATSYISVHLFARAVEKAGSFEAESVREAARGLVMSSPEGRIRLDPDNFHVHRFSRIGQLDGEGQFKIVYSSKTAIKPDPYPSYKSRKDWESFLTQLYSKWGNSWECPTPNF